METPLPRASPAPVEIRRGRSDDVSALESYLAARTDTCMLLRGNLRRVGLAWSGQRYEGRYMLALRDDAVVGLVGHAWNGMIVVQAYEAVAELARATVEWSDRPVSGFAGPLEQVIAARSALGLTSAQATLDSAEVLMSLSLDAMKVPGPLTDGRVRTRRSVLFTGGAHAEAAYRAIGFVATGRFGLVLLASEDR